MVHTYSLIHDDLPAMDDDDLRRGRPTSHRCSARRSPSWRVTRCSPKAFVGDELGREGIAAERRLAAIAELAIAAGAPRDGGRADGRHSREGVGADLERVESIHRRKTGALLRAAVRIGGILAGARAAELESITRYGMRSAWVSNRR